MKTLTNKIVRQTLKSTMDEIDLYQTQLNRKAKKSNLPIADAKWIKRKTSELDNMKLGLTVLAHRLGFYVGINSGETIVRPYASKKEADTWKDIMHF